jgi:hypothetical protein
MNQRSDRLALASTGSVLGIDVGYSTTRRSSAACWLEWDGNEIDWSITRFRHLEAEWQTALSEISNRGALACAAFDGPLRRGLDTIGCYRIAEKMLTERLGGKIGKPGQSSAPVGKSLNNAANTYAKFVIKKFKMASATHENAIQDDMVVEAFPSSFLGVMLSAPPEHKIARGKRSDYFFQYLAENGKLGMLLDYFLPNRKHKKHWSHVTNHDDRAALVCALTALSAAAHDYVAVGDKNGWIILPPRQFIQKWAWADLKSNAGNNGWLTAFQVGNNKSRS